MHADALKALAIRAEGLQRDGSLGEAVTAWREALALLPPDAPQAAQVAERIEALLRLPGARALKRDGKWGGLAGVGLVGLLVAGLTKLPALAGVLGTFGVLWSAFGWKLGAGVLAALYVHELGHVVAMWMRGMTVSAPMFVPGLGAYVRMDQRAASPLEDNRIGLSGPIAGLLASLACCATGFFMASPVFYAIASLNAIINALNLCPVWQLDGARGFASLVRWQRIAITVAFAAAFGLTRIGPLLLPLAVSLFATVSGRPAKTPDNAGFVTFLALIAALTVVAHAAGRAASGVS